MLGPSNTINLGGASLTIGALELIVKVANEHGEVLIKDIGHTSIIRLGVDIALYAKRNEVKDGA